MPLVRAAGLTVSALCNWSSQLSAAKRKHADGGSAEQPMRHEAALGAVKAVCSGAALLAVQLLRRAAE